MKRFMAILMIGALSVGALLATGCAMPAEGGDAAAGGGDLIGMLLPFALIILVMYFVIMRPQRKKDKAVKKMLSEIKVSDRVCTIGGIYGTITALKDDTVTIQFGADKNTMVIARWGIRSVEDAPLENDKDALV